MATTTRRNGGSMATLNAIALLLIVVGGINWGLIGLFGFNLVEWLFVAWAPWLATLTYILVGVAAVYAIYLFKPVTNYERGAVQHEPATARR